MDWENVLVTFVIIDTVCLSWIGTDFLHLGLGERSRVSLTLSLHVPYIDSDHN